MKKMVILSIFTFLILCNSSQVNAASCAIPNGRTLSLEEVFQQIHHYDPSMSTLYCDEQLTPEIEPLFCDDELKSCSPSDIEMTDTEPNTPTTTPTQYNQSDESEPNLNGVRYIRLTTKKFVVEIDRCIGCMCIFFNLTGNQEDKFHTSPVARLNFNTLKNITNAWLIQSNNYQFYIVTTNQRRTHRKNHLISVFKFDEFSDQNQLSYLFTNRSIPKYENLTTPFIYNNSCLIFNIKDNSSARILVYFNSPKHHATFTVDCGNVTIENADWIFPNPELYRFPR